ncbi:MAG: hypothetical protein M1836_002047 [Candelina mexicana]|nr:MAG: hypothetical protein M1836_002047 [Candelina mexicana]
MARSDEAEWWFSAVYEAVQEIPYGKVTSYGHIARLLGRPECPRQVGVCLKHLPSAAASPTVPFHDGNVPWQRVINAKGAISPRGPSGATRQAAALRREGVRVSRGSLGELTVDFGIYGWFPSILPSEAAEESDSDDEGRVVGN